MNDEILYNDSNDAKQTWEIGGQEVTGDVLERIDLESAETLTVPGCKHENVTKTPTKEFENMLEVVCNDCPIGWYVRVN